jgi:hypothetical protein
MIARAGKVPALRFLSTATCCATAPLQTGECQAAHRALKDYLRHRPIASTVPLHGAGAASIQGVLGTPEAGRGLACPQTQPQSGINPKSDV